MPQYDEKALTELKNMEYVQQCKVGEILGDGETIDVQLFLPIPQTEGVYDFYKKCVEKIESHSHEDYTMEVSGDTHSTPDGEPYFHVSITPD